MITKENILYSLRNLVQRKSRSMLTILSIFIGITTIFIFISFGWGLYDYINNIAEGSSADKFSVEGKGMGAPGTSSVVLDDSDIDAIEKTRGVIEAMGMYFDVAEAEEGEIKKYVFASGGDADKMNIMMESFGIGILNGRQLALGDDNKVTLGYNYQIPDKVFPKAINLNDKITINGIDYKAIGFYEPIGNPSDDANIYMTKEGFLRAFPDEESYAMIYGRAKVEEMDAVVERVTRELRKHRGEEEGKEEFFVTSFVDQIEAFSSALYVVIFFVILIALISVAVSAVNTANTMVTSVLERTREIGVLKAIGARNSTIFNIFLFESSFLGFIAGIIGVFLGWIVTAIAGATLEAIGWGFLSPHYSFSLFMGCIFFATIVGAISGVAPAINAAKRKPVDSLRYE